MTGGRLIAGAVVTVALAAALTPGASAQITLPPPDAPPEVVAPPAHPPAAPISPNTPPPAPVTPSPVAPPTGSPAPRTSPEPLAASASDRLEAALARAQRRARIAAQRREAAILHERRRVEREARKRARVALLVGGDGGKALPQLVSSIGAFSVMLLILGALALVGLPLSLDRLASRSPAVTRTLQRGGVRLTLQATSLVIASAVVYAVIVPL